MSFRADRHVHILIIGGGAIGTSVAYHLARGGAKDVLLVEKAMLRASRTGSMPLARKCRRSASARL